MEEQDFLRDIAEKVARLNYYLEEDLLNFQKVKQKIEKLENAFPKAGYKNQLNFCDNCYINLQHCYDMFGKVASFFDKKGKPFEEHLKGKKKNNSQQGIHHAITDI